MHRLNFMHNGELWEHIVVSDDDFSRLNQRAEDNGITLDELFARGISRFCDLLSELPEDEQNEAGINAMLARMAAAKGKTWDYMPFAQQISSDVAEAVAA